MWPEPEQEVGEDGVTLLAAGMTVEPIVSPSCPDWLRMRVALWPGSPEHEHLLEMQASVAERRRFAQFRACAADGTAIGFAEASLRSDYVNGTESSPVGYLEGLYVEPEYRRSGVASALVGTVASWARGRGCSELASDTPLANQDSQAAHLGMGFAETERIVFYSMSLTDPNSE